MYFVSILLLTFTDWTTLSKAFVKAQHLETITLPMKLGVRERNVSNRVEVALSALTKLPALEALILNIDSYEVRCVVLE